MVSLRSRFAVDAQPTAKVEFRPISASDEVLQYRATALNGCTGLQRLLISQRFLIISKRAVHRFLSFFQGVVVSEQSKRSDF